MYFTRSVLLSLVCTLGISSLSLAATGQVLPKLKVSANGRFLVTERGTPFFWLVDTAWFLPKVSSEEVVHYLSDRAQKKFNGVQIVLQYHADILYKGTGPARNGNTDTPNEIYWRHIDHILSEAETRGIYVGITVMWAEDYAPTFKGDVQKAYRWGHWMGKRYRERNNVLWIVSGEYDDTRAWSVEMYNSMARGLHDGHGNNHLMTIHPSPKISSSKHFHHEAWLDFNMMQSGHRVDRLAYGQLENHTVIEQDLALVPAKPVMDGESAYEDIIEGFFQTKSLTGPRVRDDTVRRKAYWAVFAGAFGHTYGNENIEIMYETGDNDYGFRHRPWKEALDDPGAGQMQHLRALIESRALVERLPDQALIVSEIRPGIEHTRATRAVSGEHGLIYMPTGGTVTADLSKIAGKRVNASWFDPRKGTYTPIGAHPNTGTRLFEAPGGTALGNDWVLVLEAMN